MNSPAYTQTALLNSHLSEKIDSRRKLCGFTFTSVRIATTSLNNVSPLAMTPCAFAPSAARKRFASATTPWASPSRAPAFIAPTRAIPNQPILTRIPTRVECGGQDNQHCPAPTGFKALHLPALARRPHPSNRETPLHDVITPVRGTLLAHPLQTLPLLNGQRLRQRIRTRGGGCALSFQSGRRLHLGRRNHSHGGISYPHQQRLSSADGSSPTHAAVPAAGLGGR